MKVRTSLSDVNHLLIFTTDNKLPHVPGTVVLDDDVDRNVDHQQTISLKHGTGSDAHIVLNPQPSEDPNDPLNWPMWKKEMVVYIILFGGLMNTAVNVSLCPPVTAQHSLLTSVPGTPA